jgi:O-antigen/teichoic acid export membrane protein
VLLIFHTDSLIISGFIGVAAITGYTLVYRFVGIIGQMLANIAAVLFPEVARMYALRQYHQILRLHDRLTAYLSGISLVCFGGLYFAGEWIFRLWMGDLTLFNRDIFIIFLITNGLFVISIPATYFLGAVGWHRFSTSLGLAQGVINVGISMALVGTLGVTGVALGTLISFVLTNFLANIVYFRRRMAALAGETERINAAELT